jgi:hypothetical protein
MCIFVVTVPKCSWNWTQRCKILEALSNEFNSSSCISSENKMEVFWSAQRKRNACSRMESTAWSDSFAWSQSEWGFRKDYISTFREVFYNRLCRDSCPSMVKICLAYCILSAEYNLVAQDFRSVSASTRYSMSWNSSIELLYAMVDIVIWTADGEIRGCSGFTNTWRREI